MASNLLVRDVMIQSVLTVTPNTSVQIAAKLMASRKVGSVLVVDKKSRVVGLATERDMIGQVVAAGGNPSQLPIKKIMSSPVITISPLVPVDEAAERLYRTGIRRLPVIDKGKVIGIITASDIISAVPTLVSTLEANRDIVVPERRTLELGGICSCCGQDANELYLVNGSFVCDSCKGD